MLLNLSNHPSSKWSPEQLSAAQQYGEIVDMAFPAIAAEADTSEIIDLAEKYYQMIVAQKHSVNEPIFVHLMGEFTFTFALVNRLCTNGIQCMASTTRRNVSENTDGSKTTNFEFVRFRLYS